MYTNYDVYIKKKNSVEYRVCRQRVLGKRYNYTRCNYSNVNALHYTIPKSVFLILRLNDVSTYYFNFRRAVL